MSRANFMAKVDIFGETNLSILAILKKAIWKDWENGYLKRGILTKVNISKT